VPEGDGDYAALDPPGGGTALTFQQAAFFIAPTWPDPSVQQQMHLDVACRDRRGTIGASSADASRGQARDQIRA